jgi:Zn-dependent protease with chaperone function
LLTVFDDIDQAQAEMVFIALGDYQNLFTMTRYFKFALVFLYILLTILGLLLVLILSGIHIAGLTRWLIVAGWIVYCSSSAWLFTDLNLYFSQVRLPIRSEEERMISAFTTVSKNAGSHPQIRLRVIESDEWNAFAIGVRTIAISKAMLRDLSPNELEGVMAHELGHIISYDTIIAAAYVQARFLTYGITIVFRWIAGVLTFGFRKQRRPRLSHGVIWLVFAAILLYYLHFLPLTLFVITFAILNRIFRLFDLLLSRLTEYRQDAFAHRLGFGKDLRDVLEKLAQQREQPVSPYFIAFHGTHPIIYNRIRRLEQLEDAEDQRRTLNTNPTP